MIITDHILFEEPVTRLWFSSNNTNNQQTNILVVHFSFTVLRKQTCVSIIPIPGHIRIVRKILNNRYFSNVFSGIITSQEDNNNCVFQAVHKSSKLLRLLQDKNWYDKSQSVNLANILQFLSKTYPRWHYLVVRLSPESNSIPPLYIEYNPFQIIEWGNSNLKIIPTLSNVISGSDSLVSSGNSPDINSAVNLNTKLFVEQKHNKGVDSKFIMDISGSIYEELIETVPGIPSSFVYNLFNTPSVNGDIITNPNVVNQSENQYLNLKITNQHFEKPVTGEENKLKIKII